MKKITALSLVILILCTSLSFSASADSFEDTRFGYAGIQFRIPAFNSKLPTQAIRFISSMSADLYEQIKASGNLPKSASDTDLGFGTVLLPTSMIPEGEKLTKETANAAIVPAVKLMTASDGEVVRFNACIVDLTTADELSMQITYVPYATYMDGDTKVTVYGEEHATSFFDIALLACAKDSKEDQYTQEHLNDKILHVVNPSKYPLTGFGGIYRP